MKMESFESIIAKPASCAVAAARTAAPQTAGTCIDGNETVCWGRTRATLNVALSSIWYVVSFLLQPEAELFKRIRFQGMES